MGNFRTFSEVMNFTLENFPTWMERFDEDGNEVGGRKAAIVNCNHFINMYGRSFPVKKINTAIMLALRTRSIKELNHKNSTWNKILSAVHCSLSFCHASEKIADPPLFQPRALRLAEDELQVLFFTMQEIHTMVTHARHVHYRDDLADLILGAAMTGTRQNELLRLKVRDVDFDKNRIYVGGREDFVTKARKAVWIPILEPLLPVLRERCRDNPQTAKVFGEDWQTRHCIRYPYEQNLNACMPENRRYPYKQVRHTFCTAMAEIGYPTEYISDLAGHRNPRTTKRYIAAVGKRKEQIMADFSQKVGFMTSANPYETPHDIQPLAV